MTWILSVISLLTVYLIGEKNINGWIVGLFGQVLWISWEIYTKNWGLMPMTIVMTYLYIKSLNTWGYDRKT